MKNIVLKVVILLVLFAFFAYKVYFSFDFVKQIYKSSGIICLALFFTSAIFNYFSHYWAKFLGKSAFLFALIHFLNFIIVDNQLFFADIYKNLLKYNNLLGFFAFIIMLSLFYLSKKFVFLAKYALLLASLHYCFSVKIPQFWHYFALVAALILLINWRKNDIRKNGLFK